MRRRKLLGFVGGAAIAFVGCNQKQQAVESLSLNSSKSAARTPKISQDYFGLNIGTELSWKSWRGKLLPLYEALGCHWLRVWYNWADLETQSGNYQGSSVQEALQLAKKSGFRILFVVWGTPAHAGKGDIASVPDTQALANYCNWLKTYFGDLVDAWEIGNEPNLSKYYLGSPASYIKTLATAYQVMQGDKLVVAAAPSGAATTRYWQELLESGLEQHCDRVNLHPYRQQPRQVIRLVDDFLQRVRKPLWITEVGFSSNNGNEQAKAAFATELLPLLATRAEQIFWYRGVQGKGLHPLRFGLVEVNRATGKVAPLPAYSTYHTFARKYQS